MIPLWPSSGRGRAVAAVLSGVLLALCFPNASLVALLPVALVPFVGAVAGEPPTRAAVLGYACGFSFFVGTVGWIGFTVHRFGELSWPLSALAVVLSGLILGAAFVVPAVLVALVAPRTPLGTALTWGAAWVAQESVRIHAFSGFPWALVAYPLADRPVFTQTAALGGTLLTSFLVVFVNALLHAAITRREPRSRVAWLAAAAAVAFGAGAFGVARLSRPVSASPWIEVGVVQPNVAQEVRWTPEARQRIWEDLKGQTRRLVRAAARKPDLVLWPESAVPMSWSWSPLLRDETIALCRELDVAILMSTAWSDRPSDDDAPYYNAALLVTKDGPVLPPYFKVRLVPFGEYVPLGSLLSRVGPISRAVPGSFSPGDRPRPIPFAGGGLGGAICYEVVYPWVLREQTTSGATLLFTLTNDAWYGRSGARGQHWQAAVFRAVETGRPLVRAAVTGLSGYVDPRGVPYVLGGPDERTSFSLSVPRVSETPPAVGAGAAVEWVCLVALLTAILRARAFPPRKLGAA